MAGTEKSPLMKFFELGMGPHDALFAQLPSRELVRLMQTCRLIRDLAYQVCFNPTRLLSPFFGDKEKVDRFRQIQADTGTLISGSMALQFLERTTYPGSDLDLYAYKAHAEQTVAFLLEIKYKFKPRAQQKPNVSDQLDASVKVSHLLSAYPSNGIVDVLEFTKGDKKIQLMLAKASPLEVILDFHSTVVMNFISHASAYSLYPWSTFVMKRALHIGYSMDNREDGRQKYVRRGWQMSSTAPPCAEFEKGLRWVGDRHTWTLPLDLPPNAHKLDFSTGNSWKLHPEDYFQIGGTQLGCGHPNLRFSYFSADFPRYHARSMIENAVKQANLSPLGTHIDADIYLLQILWCSRELRSQIEHAIQRSVHLELQKQLELNAHYRTS